MERRGSHGYKCLRHHEWYISIGNASQRILIKLSLADDRATFQRQFQESIQNKSDLLAYARLQCKTAKDLYPNMPALQLAGLSQATEDTTAAPKEILFEIKGYPHFVGENVGGMPSFTTATEACVMAGQSQHRLSDERSGNRGPFRCYFAMAKPYPSRNTAM